MANNLHIKLLEIERYKTSLSLWGELLTIFYRILVDSILIQIFTNQFFRPEAAQNLQSYNTQNSRILYDVRIMTILMATRWQDIPKSIVTKSAPFRGDL